MRECKAAGAGRRTLLTMFLVSAALICFTLNNASAAATPPGRGRARATLSTASPGAKDPASVKVSAAIRSVVREVEKVSVRPSRGASTLRVLRSSPVTRVDEHGAVQIYVHARGSLAQAGAALRAHGGRIELANEKLGILQAWLPAEELAGVAALDVIERISSPSYRETRAGSVTTEGDAILGGPEVRALGLEGEGVRIGVISDGVNNRAPSEASGDLPSFSIVTFPGDGDEGTAMLEIVHDIAPAAELGFCGSDTSLEFIQCVEDLRQQFGADIIVDDLGFYFEPYFADGAVSEAAREAVGAGVLFVSAAGNDAQRHYQGEYDEVLREATFAGETETISAHNFGGGQTVMPVEIRSGDDTVFFQWSNPFGGASDDYDICLTDVAGQVLEVCAEETQDGTGDPLEVLSLTCDDPTGCIGGLLVRKFSGDTRTIEIYSKGVNPQQFNVPADSIFGHPAVPGIISVAATDAQNPDNVDIEPFSSLGPSTILFPARNIRQTPEVTGIDGVAITGAGGFDNPFFGTSAAAPHVAAVAALLMSGSSSADAVARALEESAVDLGAGGRDTTFGFGRVDALAAATRLGLTGGGGGNGHKKGGGGGCAVQTPAGAMPYSSPFALLLGLNLVAFAWKRARRS